MRNNPAAALLLSCALGVPFLAGTAAASAPASFAIHEIASGQWPHQTVLSGAFGDGARLAVLNSFRIVDAPHMRWRVRFYGFEGTRWNVVHDAFLAPAHVLFFDVAKSPRRDRLLLYRNDGISWYDLDGGTERRLAEASLELRRWYGSVTSLPLQVDITRDLNGDGYDDLVLPDFDGFRVALQSPDGSFAAAVPVGPPPPYLDANAYDWSSYFEPYTLRERGFDTETIPWHVARAHTLDYDRDGLPDLAFWNEDRFDVHRQNETGAFDAAPIAFAPGVAFDFDGSYALEHHFKRPSVLSVLLPLGRRKAYRALHGFRDVDADGIADLVILGMRGRSASRIRGRIEIHYGRATPNGTAFHDAPDAAIDMPGRASGGEHRGDAWHRFVDLDGDGTSDLALGAFDLRMSHMLRKSAAMKLTFFRLRGRADPERLNAPRRAQAAFRPVSPDRGDAVAMAGVAMQEPTVLVGDVDGDGRADLLIDEGRNELAVHLGTAGDDPFSAQPIRVKVDRAAGGRRDMWLADLLGDGRMSVIIQTTSETGPNRVMVVTAATAQLPAHMPTAPVDGRRTRD